MARIKFKDHILGSHPIGLAPMAGVSDQAYRSIVKSFGCDWLVSEMVSAKGLLYQNEKTWVIMNFSEEERPYGVQLFGSDPYLLAEAAQKVESLNVDFIDFNMGCPMPKIVNNGEGSALMKEPEKAEKIIRAMVQATSLPVTVKIRLGWSQNQKNALEVAQRMEDAGAYFVTIHGRTREEFYSGSADWAEIAKIKKALTIPVIGNGDVTSPEAAKRLFEETGCDGIMIGRAAQGNPWIFRQVKDFFDTGSYQKEISWEERWKIFWQHLVLLAHYKGEVIAVKEMRSHGAWYTKGLPGAAIMRRAFSTAQTLEDYRKIAKEYAVSYGLTKEV